MTGLYRSFFDLGPQAKHDDRIVRLAQAESGSHGHYGHRQKVDSYRRCGRCCDVEVGVFRVVGGNL